MVSLAALNRYAQVDCGLTHKQVAEILTVAVTRRRQKSPGTLSIRPYAKSPAIP